MLESLYPFEYVENRHLYAVILGVCYSIIALGISVIVFPSDPSLISLAIITLLLYPTIQKLTKEHELIEAKRFHPGIFSFFQEHKNIFLFYLIICLSIFAVFFAFSFINPQSTSVLFQQQEQVVQLNTRAGFMDLGIGEDILANILFYIQHNMKVLVLIFIAAFVLGEGGMLLLSWNASAWGVYFGATLATVMGFSQQAFLTLITVLPHVALELSAYIIGVITASILSRAYFADRVGKRKKDNILMDSCKAAFIAFGTVVVAAIVETIAFLIIFTKIM